MLMIVCILPHHKNEQQKEEECGLIAYCLWLAIFDLHCWMQTRQNKKGQKKRI